MKKNIYVFSCLVRRIRDDDVGSLSAQLAYSLLMSLMPFMIFLITVIGFSSINSEDVLNYLVGLVPRDAYNLLKNAVKEVVDSKNGNLLSFSLLVTIWSASTAINTIIKVLNHAYDENEKRGFIKVQLISILFTIGLVLSLFMAIVLIVFGNTIGNYLSSKFHIPHYDIVWDMIRYLIMAFMLIFIFAALYHYTPSRRLTWKEVIPGTLFCAGGWLIASIVFSFYVDNFSNYSQVYGSIAAIFILLVWLYLSSMIILIGGEINAMLVLDMKKIFPHTNDS